MRTTHQTPSIFFTVEISVCTPLFFSHLDVHFIHVTFIFVCRTWFGCIKNDVVLWSRITCESARDEFFFFSVCLAVEMVKQSHQLWKKCAKSAHPTQYVNSVEEINFEKKVHRIFFCFFSRYAKIVRYFKQNPRQVTSHRARKSYAHRLTVKGHLWYDIREKICFFFARAPLLCVHIEFHPRCCSLLICSFLCSFRSARLQLNPKHVLILSVITDSKFGSAALFFSFPPVSYGLSSAVLPASKNANANGIWYLLHFECSTHFTIYCPWFCAVAQFVGSRAEVLPTDCFVNECVCAHIHTQAAGSGRVSNEEIKTR